MNKNVIGFILSTVLLFVAYIYVASRYMNHPSSPHVNAPSTASVPAAPPQDIAQTPLPQEVGPSPVVSNPPVTPPAASLQPTPIDPQLLHHTGTDVSLGFKERGGCLYSATLNHFFTNVKKQDRVEVLESHLPCAALGVRLGQSDLRLLPAAAQRPNMGNILVFEHQVMGVVVRRVFTLPQSGYELGLHMQVINQSGQPFQGPIGIEVGPSSERKGSGSLFGGHAAELKEIVVKTTDSLRREKLPFTDQPALKELLRTESGQETVEWAAAGSNSFGLLLIPQQNHVGSWFMGLSTGQNISSSPGAAPERTMYEGWLEQPLQLPAGGQIDLNYKVYLGPKTKEQLSKYGEGATHLIDYGFFKIVAWPIFYGLSFLEKLLKNWGIAIIVLTFSIKMLFYPLTLKAYLAGKKMQKIQPQLNEIKEKYKDDKQKQSQELMAIMAKSGANPMSGCLPILPQMPVFFALYAVLQHTFELRHAPFFLWIKDLSALDPYYVSPLILGVLMFIQQKLTPMPSVDPTQAKMMQFLPVIFTLLMISLPSGLVLYMLTNTAVSILQQQYMIRKYKEV